MQYISLLSAGGWWLSCTEILGTLEMTLQGQQEQRVHTSQAVQRRSIRRRTDSLL